MIMLRLRLRQASRRSLHTQIHTIFLPTAISLQAFLTSNPPPPTSTSLYLLSTSLLSLPSLLSTLQSNLPSSIGSFSSNPPGHPPYLSLAIFDQARIFRSELSGRRPAEVGHWQRPTHVEGGYAEDRKGNELGSVETVRGEEGWAGLWGQAGGGRIPELEGVK